MTFSTANSDYTGRQNQLYHRYRQLERVLRVFRSKTCLKTGKYIILKPINNEFLIATLRTETIIFMSSCSILFSVSFKRGKKNFTEYFDNAKPNQEQS